MLASTVFSIAFMYFCVTGCSIVVFHRSTLYKGVVGDLMEMSMLNIGDTYQDFDVMEKPLAATVGITVEKTLVEIAFGLAQKGSVLSYQ